MHCYAQHPIHSLQETDGKVHNYIKVHTKTGENFTLVWYKITEDKITGKDTDGRYREELLQNILYVTFTKKTKTGRIVHAVIMLSFAVAGFFLLNYILSLSGLAGLGES